MKKTTMILGLLLCLANLLSFGQTSWTDLVYNQNVPNLELNPMKGLMPGYGIKSGNTMPYSTDHFYITLKEINTARGVYDWTAFENKIASKGVGGRHVVGRVWLFYPGEATGVPQYLINEGVKMYGACPDWNDTKLNQALKDFIAAYGAKYDGDPRIACIEGGLYGSWGEWNTVNSPTGVTAMTQQNMDNLIIAYDNAFNKTHIALRYGDKASTEALARTVGYYDDSFCYETLYTSWCFWPKIVSKGIGNIWETHPISGEMRPEVQQYIFDSWPNPKSGGGKTIEDLVTCVTTTHISLSKCGYPYSNIPTTTERTNAIRMIKMMGYEFYVRQAKLTPNTNGTVKVEVNILNKGVSPIYYNWAVEIGAINTSTGALSTIKTTDWNVNRILPTAVDTYKTVTTNALANGTYKILMRFANPLGSAFPLRFANSTQDADQLGWLTLGTATVGGSTIPPTSVSVSPTTLSLATIGNTGQLTATVLPSNATDKNVIWSVSPSGIVTVSSTGLVTAVANGTATVTATTINGLTASCIVNVSSVVLPTSISVTPTTMLLTAIGQTGQITPTVLPSNANDKTVIWSVSPSGIVTVNSTGLVTAVANGSATVTATTVNGLTAICAVTVTISSGFDAYSQIEAENYSSMSIVQAETCTEGGQNIGWIENGDYIVFNNVNFGTGAASFDVRVASGATGGSIEVRLDGISGTLVGTCAVTGTGGWQTWVTKTCAINGASGTHNLYLKFTGGTGYLFNINWFKFIAGTSGEALPWNETFTMANGATTDVAPTSWTATNMRVLSNEIAFNNKGTDGVFTTGAINIAGNNVRVSVSVRGGTGLDVNQDFLKLYKKVDGGAEVQIAAADGPQASATWTADITTGSSLVLVLRAHVTATTEYYYFDNLSVTSTGLKSALTEDLDESTDNNSDDVVMVYPNPVSKTLNIKHAKGATIRIVNTHNQVIINKVTNGTFTSFNVAELNTKGFIIVQLIDGKKVMNHKVIVK